MRLRGYAYVIVCLNIPNDNTIITMKGFENYTILDIKNYGKKTDSMPWNTRQFEFRLNGKKNL